MNASLDALLEALRPYRPQRIILFGSAARGDADAASDFDLLVIKETQEPFVARLEAMARLCPAGVRADILVYTPQEIEAMLQEDNAFITEALRDGKVVYEAER
ncbi:MAG TPA: nucleotidyltransferase domain-containing protein [Acidobacteriota bacterium]|jgi:predicted nucleotidyltransferase